MVEIDISGIHATLGKVKIEKNREDMKKNRERVQNDILHFNHVDCQILNDLLVKPSLQHQITQKVVVQIQRNLPLVHKNYFCFN